MKARDDTRPPVAFGHVFLNVTDVSTSADCLKLGMSCTENESTDFHDKFTITGPDQRVLLTRVGETCVTPCGRAGPKSSCAAGPSKTRGVALKPIRGSGVQDQGGDFTCLG